MFGRKKRHIEYLECENEMFRNQSQVLHDYVNCIENGNIIKFLILHPECIEHGKATIDRHDLEMETQDKDIFRIDNPGTNHFGIRVVDKE